MKIIKILLFCFTFAGCLDSAAQTTFLRGYYITQQGDTIRGYIDYHNQSRNFNVCKFKSEPSSRPIRLNPQDIRGFVIDDRNYYETMSYTSHRKKKTETVYGFFKLLVKGELSLLQYESRYFARNKSNELFEISKKIEIKNDTLRRDFHGVGVLKDLMRDCPQLMGATLEMQYKGDPNYVRIFEKYNSCVGGEFKKTDKITMAAKVGVGAHVSFTSTKLNPGPSVRNATMKPDFTFCPGLSTSLFMPKLGDPIRLVIEATYGNYSQYSFFSALSSNNDLFINYSFLKVPVIFRYDYRGIFFDLGYQNHFILGQNIRWRIETINADNTVDTRDGYLTPLYVRNSGFLVGGGYHFKLHEHSIRSSIRYSQFSNDSIKQFLQSIELQLSIQLTK